jgi:predicted transcriptional regulator
MFFDQYRSAQGHAQVLVPGPAQRRPAAASSSNKLRDLMYFLTICTERCPVCCMMLRSSAASTQHMQTPIDPRCLRAYNLKMPAPVRPPLLGDLENAVMNHLWDGGEGEAKAVHAALGSRRGITLNTIQSTLKRLYEKHLLERDKVSHAHVYAPRVTREQFHRELLGGIVDGLMDRQGEAVVSAFVDLAERAGPEHLARLETLVADRRRKLEGKR